MMGYQIRDCWSTTTALYTSYFSSSLSLTLLTLTSTFVKMLFSMSLYLHIYDIGLYHRLLFISMFIFSDILGTSCQTSQHLCPHVEHILALALR